MRIFSVLAVLTSTLGTCAFGASGYPDLIYHGNMAGEPTKLNPYGGHELDLSSRRPIVSLEGTALEAFYGKREDTRLIANFYHENKFWIARIPTHSAQHVDAMFTVFDPVAAHMFLRFELDPNQPLELIAEVPSEEAYASRILTRPLDQPIRMANLLMTAEAQWTKDDPHQSYSLVRGAEGQFASIVRITSAQDRFEKSYIEGNPTSQVRLNLNVEESERTLLAALDMSEEDGVHRIYNTLSFNCTTRSLDAVERGAPAKSRKIHNKVERVWFDLTSHFAQASKVVPILTEKYGLAERGLVDDNVSMPGFFDDPGLQDEARAGLESLVRSQGCKALASDVDVTAEHRELIKALVQRLAPEGSGLAASQCYPASSAE